MPRTQLSWEEVSSYERLDKLGTLWKNQDDYYYVAEEGTVFSWLAIYELPYELYCLLQKGQRTSQDIHHYLVYEAWPEEHLTPKERINRVNKRRAEGEPQLLMSTPSYRDLFSEEELAVLLPLAEKRWAAIQTKRKTK